MSIGVYIRKPNIKYGMTGNHHSEETKRKMSLSHKGKPTWSSIHRKEMSDIFKNRISPMKGKHHTLKTKEKMKESHKGKKHWNWQGGISLELYPEDWTDDLRESIRKRDNYVCQLCGLHQDEIDYRLHCHHIDYNKNNLNPNNLITLCRRCHRKTNYNRQYWFKYFSKLI